MSPVKNSREKDVCVILPDLNLLRISMECSEPSRVIMLHVQFQYLKSQSKWTTHTSPASTGAQTVMSWSVVPHQLL